MRYEDLVLRTVPALEAICAFLGADYSPQMLDYPADALSEMPRASLLWHGNSVRAPDPALVGAWKRRMSRADRVIFEQVAGDTLELFGYEREKLASTWGSRARNLYYATVQRW